MKKTPKLLVLSASYDIDNKHFSVAHGRLRNCIIKAKVLKGL